MASEPTEEAKRVQAEALALFRSGQTKAEIAKHLNKDRKSVGQLIAKAIREQPHGIH